jgi:hypothetical protein
MLAGGPAWALLPAGSRARAHPAATARAAVLLGGTALEPGHPRIAAGRLEAFRLRARASGVADSVRIFIDAGSSAQSFAVGIYANHAGSPGRRLAAGSRSHPDAGQWDTVEVSPRGALRAGRIYWLSVSARGGALGYRSRPGSCPAASADGRGWSVAHSAVRTPCPISAYVLHVEDGLDEPLTAEGPGAGSVPGSPLQVLAGAPVSILAPAVSGSAIEGQTLKATTGSWSEKPVSYAYQWQQCNSTGGACVKLAGEVAGSYKLRSSDVGHTMRVLVTATNLIGATTASSAATALVTAPGPQAPSNTSPPTIGGPTVEGQTLSVNHGGWSETPTSYGYQWERCDSAGAACSELTGQTATTYLLGPADVGETLRVIVTATNGVGSGHATSAPSGVITLPSAGCTRTLGTGENVAAAVNAAAGGAVICLSSGSYGPLSFETSHSSDVTLEGAPGAHVEVGKLSVSASHLVLRGLWVHGEVALAAGDSYVTIDHDDITGGGEGVVFDTSNCKAPNAPSWPECEPQAPVSNVTISGDHFHDIGLGESEDAIHIDWWSDLTVTGNEFERILESGNHTDCLQSVYGGTNLTFTHNYEHNNDCQGIFIKDGDATNVTVSDNLFLRDHEGSYANFAQIWNSTNLVMEKNTIWDGKGLALVADNASFAPTATIQDNLIEHFTVEPPTGTPYSLTEGHDIFGESPTGFTAAGSDSVQASPPFKDPATDDYRLSPNPDGIGVDWAPAEQHYGPAS